MRIRKKKANLTLGTHNRKRSRDKPYKSSWPNSSLEALGMLEIQPVKSPICSSLSKKRVGSRSPYIHHSPYKYTPSKVTSQNKVRKCLFEDSGVDLSLESPIKDAHEQEPEVATLISEAMEALKHEGMDTLFNDFFRLVRQGGFPLDNIALTLFADVVRWYSCKSSTEMRYSRESKLFWKLGYRLFGGRFLHYMGGPKNDGQIVLNQSERGIFDPLSSKINFAVPSIVQLTRFDPYDLQSNIKINCSRPFAPGLLRDMISTLGSKVKGISCCLTFDGKKIKQGLTRNFGDVDMFGFENKGSLDEKKQKLISVTTPFRDLQDKIYHHDGSDEISELSSGDQDEVKGNLKRALQIISEDILEIQDVRKKKLYAKQKFIDRCGEENWKNSKFAMAISCIIAFIHDIDTYLGNVREVLNELILCITTLNGTQTSFIEDDRANIHDCKNYKRLPEKDLSEQCDTREIKQRTDKWYERRTAAKVTGSTLFTAIGLDGLRKQQDYFDVVVCGNNKAPIPKRVSELFQYGTENEINAVVTLVGKVMPAFFPGKLCCEEGFVEIDLNDDGVPFMIVSPDGSIRSDTDMETTEIALEFKCPVMDIHRYLPARYVLQCQAEMDALGVDSLVYVCWRPDYSSVFLVKKDTDLYSQAYQIAKSLYKDSGKRVKKVAPEIKELKRVVQQSSQEQGTVEFLGLFPSLKHDISVDNTSTDAGFRLNRLHLLLSNIVKVMEDRYEIAREKATEAVVFICSTLDRHLSSKAVTAPVCWFTKGNSLDVATTRNILEHVLDACFLAEIHIPAISFDGQWHAIAVRDAENKPLTKLQLQKDVWRETENLKKESILNKMKNLNKEPQWEKKNGAFVAYSNCDETLPAISQRVIDQRRRDSRKQQKIADISVSDSSRDENANDVKTSEDVSEESIPTTTETCKTFVFDASKAAVLLTMLQTDPFCNKKQQWNGKTTDYILACLQTPDNIRKLRDVDLKVVVRFLKRNGQKLLRECDNKATKVNNILTILGLSDSQSKASMTNKLKKKRQTPTTLKSLAYSEVSKLRKSDVNIILAEYVWPGRLNEWQTNAFMSNTRLYEDSTLTDEGICEDKFETKDQEDNEQLITENNGTVRQFTEFFYIPAYSRKRRQFEVSCVDSSHLLTRTRRKCCKGGLDGCLNIAWKRVAKLGKTNLSTAMVECILDQMSVSTALSHFSESVEKEMRLNCDNHEADLCRDIRMWWKAEDDPGICARERVNMRLSLRKRLISHVEFGHFPPPGMFVRGWPTQLWEALLASIDAKTLLYSLSKQNTYNNRAFSSLVGETFFSEVTLYDRRGQGTISSAEFEDFMGTAVEKLHIRLDETRNFVYRTSRKTVYNLIGDDDVVNQDKSDKDVIDEDIILLDHAFDTQERVRVKGKRKEETVDTNRNALQRGALGVRWEKGRRNESKLLPTIRMGIDDD